MGTMSGGRKNDLMKLEKPMEKKNDLTTLESMMNDTRNRCNREKKPPVDEVVTARFPIRDHVAALECYEGCSRMAAAGERMG